MRIALARSCQYKWMIRCDQKTSSETKLRPRRVSVVDIRDIAALKIYITYQL